MVSAERYSRFLKEQKIKEKRKTEKESEEKKRKEQVLELAKIRKSIRESAEKLEFIEQIKLERKLAKKLELKKRERLKRERLEESRTLRIKEIKQKERLAKLEERKIKQKEYLPPKKKVEQPVKIKTREKFILSEEEKERCRKKTLEELVDEIGGSVLTCPPGKEPKIEKSPRELTADLKCFRKRIRRKSPDEIIATYDKLLEADPERLCKDK